MSVSARGWGWRWNGRRAWAVRGLDLEVADGERVLLLGASGAGKSTVLAAVAGLLDGGPDGTGQAQGQLLVDGVPAADARRRAVLAGSGRARAGLLLQDPQAQTILARCGDDVAFGLENHAVPREAIWPRVDRALADVGLTGTGPSRTIRGRDHPTSALSGGQRQRLALAGVLALAPGLLLLDEPTAMLDPQGAARLREVVAARLAVTGAGMLLVEHRTAEWLPLVDRVVVLGADGVLADGPPHRVLPERAAELAAAGVWLPRASAHGLPASAPALPHAAPGALDGRSSGGAGDGGGVRPGGAPSRATDELLVLEGVSVGRRGAPPVLAGVEATVRAGRAVVVRGPNGAGKSTLALVVAGLAAPLAGRVVATAVLRGAGGAAASARAARRSTPLGEDPSRWRPRELVARIGSVFQDPRHQFVAATVADELAVGGRRLGLPEAEVAARTAELLDRLRLSALAAANPFTLSGGEQRRLSVATALATRPRLLVLDEPTFGQDAVTWAELVALLRELREGGTALVLATHDDDLAAELADETWSVADGRVRVDDGAPAAEPSGTSSSPDGAPALPCGGPAVPGAGVAAEALGRGPASRAAR